MAMALGCITSRRLLSSLSVTPLYFCPLSMVASSVSSPSSSSASSSGAVLLRHYSGPSKTLNCASSVSPMSSSPEFTAPDASELDALDIRVGKIIRAWKHPDADSLYVEEVDIGEEAEGHRTICSGLVKYIPDHELQDRTVLVLANLKARNMRGVKSNGMLLAASDDSHENVELLMPPEGSIVGERVWFGCESDRESQRDAATPNQLQKKKIWEMIQPHLKTTDACVATYKQRVMRTSAGVVTCKSLRGANIS